MDSRRITKDTPFIIYGAGEKGTMYLTALEKLGYKVVCFIDRSVSGKRDGLNIYRINDEFFTDDIKHNCIVVVTVLNVFSHDCIADELHRNGFCCILFKTGLMREKNQWELYLNELYDGLYPFNTWKGNLYVPCYEELKQGSDNNNLKYTDHENLFVRYNVPIEYIASEHAERLEGYGLSFDDDMKILFDKSVLWFLYCGDLYRAMQGQLDFEENKEFIKWFKKFYVKTNTILKHSEVESMFEKHLMDRKSIFLEMEHAYNKYFQFFEENPPYLKWNARGFFNISEGKNRTAFMMSHGMMDIPCIMSKDDYEKWKSECQIIESYENRIYLKAIVKHLYKLRIELSSVTFVNETETEYFSDFFERFGANVRNKSEIKKDDDDHLNCLLIDYEKLESGFIDKYLNEGNILFCTNIPENMLEKLIEHYKDSTDLIGTVLGGDGVRGLVCFKPTGKPVFLRETSNYGIQFF